MSKAIRVLSLFDGISCGRVALERVNISVDRYVAYEIEQSAVEISRKNYPDIEHHGDVFEGDFTKYRDFDLLIGGSPCTFWSCMQTEHRELTPDGEGGKLFLEYVRALKETNCRYFLYENNHSMPNAVREYISETFGCKPILLNSALVSAQIRRRYYWTNIPLIPEPRDKGITLSDILNRAIDMGADYSNSTLTGPVALGGENGKAYTIKAQYNRTSISDAMRKGSGFKSTMALEPCRADIDKGVGYRRCRVVAGKIQFHDNVGAERDYFVDVPDGEYIVRKFTPLECERLQTLPDNYTEGLSNNQRYKCIGNGWTVDIIAHILSCMPEYW